MTKDEHEATKRLIIESGHVIHEAALRMLQEARQKGVSDFIASAAVSAAAMLISAQYFEGRLDQFINQAWNAIDSDHERTMQ